MSELNKAELNLSREDAIRYPIPLKECLFGDRKFYKQVALVTLPMVLQNTLTNVVSLLDNVMVGQVGTIPMSAVAIANQLFFVYLLCIFGALAGAGIYGTQFFGKGDYEGVRITLRFKLVLGLLLLAIACAVFLIFGNQLTGLYIAENTTAADRLSTLSFARQYMLIMLIGFLPFTLTQCYAGTLRESGMTTLPMAASMIAMVINFVFNALLIFGLLGFPKLGVVGAAVATVISRFLEFLIVAVFAHRKSEKYPFFQGLFRNFRIPRAFVPEMMKKALPLMLNETLWSVGQALLLQTYSVRGINVVAAMNINNTISHIFNEVFISLGSATAIIVGQELGAGRLVNARRSSWRMATTAVLACVVSGLLLFLAAPLVPEIYNTEPEIRVLATSLIRVVALVMPINAFANVAYFTMRSGGRVIVTFFFDSVFTIGVSVPAAAILARFTPLPTEMVFLIVCLLELIKCIIGFILMKRGVWVRNMVG